MESFENYYSRICTLLDGVVELPMWPNHELTSALFAMPIDEARNKLREAQAIAQKAGRTIITLDDLQSTESEQAPHPAKTTSKHSSSSTPLGFSQSL